jgi:hypothetical protein
MIPTLQQGQVGRYILRPSVPPNTCVDGPGWTETSIPNAESLRCMAYGNGLFVAGGIRRSTTYPCAVWSDDDGVTWNESSTTFGNESGYGFYNWSMAYGNGIWIAGMNAIAGWKSTTGKTWSKVTQPHVITRIAYGGVSNFVAATSYTGTSCYTTSDGSSYTARTLPSSGVWGVVGSNGSGTFVIARTDSNASTAVSTDDGVTWNAGGNLPFNTCATIAYGNGTWVAVPFFTDTKVAYSTDDGASWSYSNTIYAGSFVMQRVRFLQNRFTVLGAGGSLNYNSSDGITWTQIGDNVNMTSFSMDWDGDDLGAYAAIGEYGSDTTVANYGICTG